MPLTELIEYSGWNKNKRAILYDTNNNTITGNVIITGAGNTNVIYSTINSIFYISGDTGAYINFYPYNNPNNFANSGNIQNTGQTLYNNIIGFSGVFNNSGAQYQNQINSLTTNLAQTGISLKNSINILSGNVLSYLSKSITIENPTSSENWAIFRTDNNITVTKIVTVISGDSSQSLTWDIKFGANRTSAGTSIIGSPFTTTNVSTGDLITSFSNPNISGSSIIRFTTSASNGNLHEVFSTIYYT